MGCCVAKEQPLKVISKRTAKIKVYRNHVTKAYRAKYYRQRQAFRSIGEPHILDRYYHPLFAAAKQCVYNPYLTPEFIDHESKLSDSYNEYVSLERMGKHASELPRDRSHPEVQSLLKWIEGYLTCYGKLPVVHRDIQAAHIMQCRTTGRSSDSGWKLIDFAIAVPKEDWTAECEIGPRWDDVATLEAIYREFDREGK